MKYYYFQTKMRSHKKYMEIALNLAEKGLGSCSPNPAVGCVIVKRGSIVGKGYHKKCGDDHAEINALEAAGKKAENSTMYVTLEPCSHWGKTPPCTEKIIKAGVREVIIGMKDPNPKVNGYKELKFRGVKTKLGILEEEAKRINEYYLKYIRKKRPFVILKVAMTLDGKIATPTGESKYITGRKSRKYVHQIRSSVDAVMIGINTALKDNPKLTPRAVKGKDPLKIVVDSKLKIPIKKKLHLFKDPHKLIIATTNKASKKKIDKLHKKGVRVVVTRSKRGRVDLQELMKLLGKQEIASIMIEGGSELNASAISEGIADKLMLFSAPKLIGNGLGAIGNLGIKKLDKAISLKNIETKKIGRDILVEGRL